MVIFYHSKARRSQTSARRQLTNLLSAPSTPTGEHMKSTLREKLKAYVPGSIKRLRRKQKFNENQAKNRDQPLEAIFNDIYESSAWSQARDGGRYSSGPGSEPAVTQGYEDFVIAYLNKHPGVNKIVDIGCGDFQVANRVLSKLDRKVAYIGCDVASKIIAYNQATHGRNGVEFRHVDASQGPLPSGDLVLVREVFQHLSNAAIHASLANMRSAYPVAIITEAVWKNPKATNVDLVSGFHTRDMLESGIYLELPPFNLKVLDEYVCACSPNEDLRTLVIDLTAPQTDA
jgi:SAM-dependent methyltransferase